MQSTLLDQWLFFIYFIYGLAFFGMGLAMALESGRSPGLAEARVLRPLAAFGLIHGAYEWFEAYMLQVTIASPLPGWVAWFKLGTLVASFTCLFLFAYYFSGLSTVQTFPGWIRRNGLLGLYWLAVAVSALAAYRSQILPTLEFWDAMSRAISWRYPPRCFLPWRLPPAAARRARRRVLNLARYFRYAGVGFGIYAASQFVVHSLPMFPADLINQSAFTGLTGIPIQLVRSMVAVLITYSLIRATQAVEDERILQITIIQQARLEALQQREALRGKLLQHTVQAQEDRTRPHRARTAR